jgi:hypothetical protein
MRPGMMNQVTGALQLGGSPLPPPRFPQQGCRDLRFQAGMKTTTRIDTQGGGGTYIQTTQRVLSNDQPAEPISEKEVHIGKGGCEATFCRRVPAVKGPLRLLSVPGASMQWVAISRPLWWIGIRLVI